MRFLANENIPLVVVNRLKNEGFDIVSATQLYQGERDKRILTEAVKNNRIILTFDKDFGYFAFRQNELLPPGIVLFRILPKSTEYIYSYLYKIITGEFQLEGNFTVIAENKIRSVPLKHQNK